jgi:hypothetical protein
LTCPPASLTPQTAITIRPAQSAPVSTLEPGLCQRCARGRDGPAATSGCLVSPLRPHHALPFAGMHEMPCDLVIIPQLRIFRFVTLIDNSVAD